MIGAFVATVVLLLVVVAWPFGERMRFGLFVVLLAVVAAAAALQFSERCPRCGARLGLQSRLLLPPDCRRCGAALRE